MIKVTVDRTEYDEYTLEVLSVAHETYTGECARKWLKEHPEAYGDNNMYEDYNDKSYSITDSNTWSSAASNVRLSME